MTVVAEYVRDRILNAKATAHVVSHSTPVLSFGDPTRARVATLGLNPSRVEFLDKEGTLLSGAKRRLATMKSLKLRRLKDASDEQVAEIVHDCSTYFQRNPYSRWFDQLSPMLSAVGASFYDGTACHLDLVQWSTDPTWSGLPASERKSLLASDVPFLKKQLLAEPIELLLLNGRGVIRQVAKRLQVELQECAVLDGNSHQSTTLFTGLAFEKVRVIGWSTNLQSSHGVTKERRQDIASHVGGLANGGSQQFSIGYSLFEHRHRFAVWAASRAAQRKFTSVPRLRDAIQSTDLPSFVREHAGTEITPARFEELHAGWCEAICDNLRAAGVERVAFGRAAKLVAVYLKSMIVLGPAANGTLSQIAHPPIDRLVLKALARNEAIPSEARRVFRKTNWTQLDRKSYYKLVRVIRENVPDINPFWRLEQYWNVTDDG